MIGHSTSTLSSPIIGARHPQLPSSGPDINENSRWLLALTPFALPLLNSVHGWRPIKRLADETIEKGRVPMLRIEDLSFPPEVFLHDEPEGGDYYQAFQMSGTLCFRSGYFTVYLSLSL